MNSPNLKYADKNKLAQLEKAVTWWSECAANWREKWGHVHGHRNQLETDLKCLSARNEALVIEYTKASEEVERLKKEVERLQQIKKIARVEPILEVASLSYKNRSKDYKSEELETYSHTSFQNFIEKLKGDRECVHYQENQSCGLTCQVKLEKVKEYLISFDQYYSGLERENEQLKAKMKNMELSQWNEQETRQAEKTKDYKTGTYDEESNVTTLRSELYRLQAENYKEWSRREQCETETMRLSRQLNQANQFIAELEGIVNRKNEQVANAQSVGMKLLRDDLDQKAGELIETKASLNKTKRLLQQKSSEWQQEKQRAENCEEEVKKLRARIEELKTQVLKAEEEIDHQGNHARRLQRTVEEVNQQNESLQTQVNITTTRLKRQSALVKVSEKTLEQSL